VDARTISKSGACRRPGVPARAALTAAVVIVGYRALGKEGTINLKAAGQQSHAVLETDIGSTASQQLYGQNPECRVFGW
jgi:hypothetical protein